MQRDLLVMKSVYPVDYGRALAFMQNYVQSMLSCNSSCLFWFLEHAEIYTAGASANVYGGAHPPDIYITDRGGQVTYHGPGQKVIYLLLDLRQFHEPPDIRKFVDDVLDWLIESFQEIGVAASRDPENVGVWTAVGDEMKKLASVGFKVRKWITYHGVAINLKTDMSKFHKISPCGLHYSKMTSLHELGITISEEEFQKTLLNGFLKKFHYPEKSVYHIPC